ncbi:glutathione S-transferase [Natronospirillum operosum]|uniref:Glutathione S-transferase n=1 Tax=Natronospirillum operosum TaxID=2759953 RepID=A0A4Z0WCA4_9GAMM|nr:glutathione S-transferase N-terminal domain-containing protein [Natronospirillum operosum]TGG92429.1 glutathione S-transferase [Natronospirillum operosum]
MKLYLNQTSPYARVARICAIEKQLEQDLDLHWVDPWADDEALLTANPNGKIPVLVTNEGESISESLLIAAYLDGLSSARSLLRNPDFADVLALCGLSQGLTDAAFTTVINRKHFGQDSDSTVLGIRRRNAIVRCLQRLEGRVDSDVMKSDINLGQIITAVALGYIDFRLPTLQWGNDYPLLADWLVDFSKYSSFKETAFV